ncbi:uncharacterized protein ACLA_044400 [Aspergillus clavatus NRRL 1]|uniref:Uncharacterized protein n=1 Tax=Aspergillus clavatus (strain ATCC 1007 / CBS 513.65 / DSM 816 / NCTC 3887 / NRRL 1 / QM 1276 / 107) TaxID=344612 RepID=A1C8T3_ASPCL|nr:uncharacterized protein ACLA_044400 [Aspergillus clavatus NRRL 1]EAW13720.1 hypothetical protein ACLA_044400 [Aspergillus clavatus NRRL 1]
MTPSPKVKEKTFQSSLKALENAAKDVLSFTKLMTKMEDVFAQNRELEQKLEVANQTIDEQQLKLNAEIRKNEDFAEKIGQVAQRWAEEKIDLQAQIQNASNKTSIAAQRKENEMNKRVEAAERAANQSQKKLDKQGFMISKLETSLQETQHQLNELQVDVGVEEMEQEKIFNQFQTLESHLTDLIEEFFEDTIITSELAASEELGSTQLIRANSAFPLITDLPYVNFTYPRTIYAQSIIASRLSQDIFLATYLNAPTGRMSMGEVLQHSRNLRPSQKAILRSLLTTLFQPDEQRVRTETLETAASDLYRTLAPLGRAGKTHEFRQSLHEFLESAANMWYSMRTCSRLFYATSKLGDHSPSWRHSGSHVSPRDHQSSQPPAYHFLVLFPHIFCEDESPFYPGLLWIGDSNSQSPVPEKQGYCSSGIERNGTTAVEKAKAKNISTPNPKSNTPAKMIQVEQQNSGFAERRPSSGVSERSHKTLRRSRVVPEPEYLKDEHH